MSEKINDGGPAFPVTYVEGLQGMSLRDWFAGMALQGMCANPDISAAMSDQGMKPFEVRDRFASSAWAQADIMLAEREKRM